ncbi:MAG: TIGR01212 family radical SAM protein [Bacilli bacterium]|jgi:radical SAM protein (TIGR01212 family)|nr:TIGR01212 family radical SAM protein [Bacilli bacterium]
MSKPLNNFKYSDTNKHYYTYDYYLKQRYGEKVAKISLDAGFTCPNRDGSLSNLGCYFCSAKGSGDFAGNVMQSLLEQFEHGKKIMKHKWHVNKFIPYFQAYTNTYDDLSQLKQRYELFINQEDVVGIAIATRPDCLNEEIIDYLVELNKKKDIYLELGLQTFNDEIASSFNRCYPTSTFYQIMALLDNTDLKVCIHLIDGLPLESKESMLNNIKLLNNFNIHAIKIHMLNIITTSKWGKEYLNNNFKLLTRDEYVDLVVEQLRLLKEDIVVERLTGDAKKEDLLAPLWTLKKVDVLNHIDMLMAKNNYFQGDKYEK